MTELLKDSGIYAISVPVDACSIEIYQGHVYGLSHPALSARRSWAKLPPDGNYSIICTSASATEADAARVVASYGGKNKRKALQYILRSLNLNEPNYLIIKKEMV